LNAEQALRVVADINRIAPDVIVVIGGPESATKRTTGDRGAGRLFDHREGILPLPIYARSCCTGRNPLRQGHRGDLTGFSAKAGICSHAQLLRSLRNDSGHRPSCHLHRSVARLSIQNVSFVVVAGCAGAGMCIDTFLPAMERLLARGGEAIQFVDRTFNLNLNFSRAILDFFWKRYHPGLSAF